ncbi:hydantoinase B/oxoprolinase family protein [Xylophilus rhododendri]|uniref:Hydantoinase B/oxoprolinase family protein n=1 Tax=Xylophilus rhododendri TaxID=2697032 RepID=A0A857JGD4_9BURK|nr:hydantoinase B/oxoprolinase family protein [Xylophilus rhododendri]
MYDMLVLRRRFEATIREMANTLFRAGRSGVLNTAHDFSCSVTDAKLQTVSAAVGVPIHVGSIHLVPRAVVDKFGTDVHPGDCFANNSSYHGNTHCADLTLCSPVFVGGKLLFYSIARAHLADVGFPVPTTYGPDSRDYYQEGLMLPCVRIQRDGRDVQEVIDICKANIRAPEQFYGDYLAILAAVRTGEKRLQAIAEAYGADAIVEFLDRYQAYGESMMADAIRGLPGGKVAREVRYDSDLPQYPQGIPVRASMEIDPAEGRLTIDLRDNVDNLPLGINMSEATVVGSCYSAVMSMIGKDVPRCSGAFRRIDILMREGAAVGKPRFPAATSAATTNLTHILTSHLQALFADFRADLGAAYSTIGQPASAPCISGEDSRKGGKSFYNQIILGFWSGPALHGHDGWLTFGSAGAQGMIAQSSVEVVEQQQPVLVEKLEIRIDSGGAGQWRGSPGSECIIRSRKDTLRLMATSAGRDHPPPGVLGGGHGGGNWAWKIDAEGQRSVLPVSMDTTIGPGEAMVSYGCGGGGFGAPSQRDPALVARDVQDGWVSHDAARAVYGVVLKDRQPGTVDMPATRALRDSLAAAESTDAPRAAIPTPILA